MITDNRQHEHETIQYCFEKPSDLGVECDQAGNQTRATLFARQQSKSESIQLSQTLPCISLILLN